VSLKPADAATLLTDPNMTGKSALGYVPGGGGGSQGTYTDVNTTASVHYELAVYMAASSTSSKIVPRVMDLETLDPLLRPACCGRRLHEQRMAGPSP
jgi:hypothetical protein